MSGWIITALGALLSALLLSAASCDDDRVTDPCAGVGSGSLSLAGYRWVESSPPIEADSSVVHGAESMAGFHWSNPPAAILPQLLTTTRDLDPAASGERECVIHSLILNPADPGESSWFGVMRGFPDPLDIMDAGYLEIWVNDYTSDPASRSGTIYIDFGLIDEDYHQPGLDRFDDEMVVGWTEEHDTGFEGDDPSCVYPDDFGTLVHWDCGSYTFRCINSRVENYRHDTEDIDGDGRLDTRNHYFRVEIDLAGPAVVDIPRDYSYEEYKSYWDECDLPDDENLIVYNDWCGEMDCPFNVLNAWRLYRIGLADLDDSVFPAGAGSPARDRISHVRIWVPDADEVDNRFGHMIHVAGLRFTE
jgi:hypothetical protein